MLVPVLKQMMDLEGSFQASLCINVNVNINMQIKTYNMCTFCIFNLYLMKTESTADKLYSGYELGLVFTAKVSINEEL